MSSPLSQKPEEGREDTNTSVKNESYESFRNPDSTAYVCVDVTVRRSSADNEDLESQSCSSQESWQCHFNDTQPLHENKRKAIKNQQIGKEDPTKNKVRTRNTVC